MQKANVNDLTMQEKKKLNEINNKITHIMSKVEYTITSDKYLEPWPSELNNAVCIVSIYKPLSTQATTKVSIRNKLNSTRNLWNLLLIYLGKI